MTSAQHQQPAREDDGPQSLVDVIVGLFRFVWQLILTVLCLFLLLLSLLAFWRIPSLLLGELRCGSIEEFREGCTKSIGRSVFDIVTAPCAFLVLISWRSVNFCSQLTSINRPENDYWIELRLLAWFTLLRLVMDVLWAFLLIPIVLAFWRIPFLCFAIADEAKVSGFPLCGCRKPAAAEQEPSNDSMWGLNPSNSKFRMLIVWHCVYALFDIVTLFCAFIVLVSWRSVNFCSQLTSINRPENDYWIELRLLAWFTLLRLVMDVLWAFLLIPIVLAFWRIPFLCFAIADEAKVSGFPLCGCRKPAAAEQEPSNDSMWGLNPCNSKFRMLIVWHCVYALFDIVTLFCAFIVLVSWRSVSFCSKLPYTSRPPESYYWVEVRLLCWCELLRLGMDIGCAVLVLATCVAVWRIPSLVRDIAGAVRSEGFPLCGCWKPKEEGAARDVWQLDPCLCTFRMTIVRHFKLALVELLMLIVCLPLFVTVYRAPNVVRIMCDAEMSMQEKRAHFFNQLCLLLQDVPYIVCGIVAALLVVRLKYLVEDLCDARSLQERRAAAARHALRTVRDLVALPLPLFVVVISVYRFVLAALQIRASCAPWAPHKAVCSVTSAAVSLQAGRETGCCVTIDLSKPSDFSLSPGCRVAAFLRFKQDSFWDDVAALGCEWWCYATLERERPIDLSACCVGLDAMPGSTSARVTLDLDVSETLEWIRRSGASLTAPPILQLEYGERDGTLAIARVTISNAGLEMADVELAPSPRDVKGHRVLDVAWKIVLLHSALLFRDIFAFLCFFVTHMVPPRAYRIYTTGWESSHRTTARHVIHTLQVARDELQHADIALAKTTRSIDLGLRKTQEGGSYFDEKPFSVAERYNHAALIAATKSNVNWMPRADQPQPLDSEFFEPIRELLEHLAASNNERGVACVRVGAQTVLNMLHAYILQLRDEHGTALNVEFEQLMPLTTQWMKASTTPDGSLLATHVEALATLLAETEAEYAQMPCCGPRLNRWAHLRSVILREVVQTMIDILAVFAVALIVLSVYRIYSLVTSIARRGAKDDVRSLCFGMLLQIPIDFLYLLKMLVAMLGIRAIVALPRDLLLHLCSNPSFETARTVIDHHLSLLGADIMYLCSGLFAIETLKFIVATVFLGVFVPAIALEEAFFKWPDKSSKESDDPEEQQSSNRTRVAIILLFSLAWIFAVPLFCDRYLGVKNPHSVGLCFFGVMFLVCGIGIIAAFTFGEASLTQLNRSVVQEVKPTVHNWMEFAGVAWEGLLLVASAYAATSAETMTQGSAGERIRDASRYLFLEFGEDWSTGGVPFGVYFAVVVMLLQFIVSSLPIVTGRMMGWKSGSLVIHSTLWLSTLQFLGQHAMLIVARNVAVALRCCVGSTSAPTTLLMILFTIYFPPTVMRNAVLEESNCPTLDVTFAQLYRMLSNIGCAFAVVAPVLIGAPPLGSTNGAILAVVAGAFWNLIWVFVYPFCVNSTEKAISTVQAVHVYKVAEYTAVTAATIVAFVVQRIETASLWGPITSAALCVASWIAAAVVNKVLASRWDTSGIHDLRYMLLETEAALEGRMALSNDGSWSRRRPAWHREVESATRVSVVALAALELEIHFSIAHMSHGLFFRRREWLQMTFALVSACDLDRFIDDTVRDASSPHCCACACQSHEEDQERGDELALPPQREKTESEKLLDAAPLITVLRNAARSDTGPVVEHEPQSV